METLLKSVKMKTKSHSLLILIFVMICITFGCKKESFKPEKNDGPTLYLRGNLDGDTLIFVAGLNSITSSTYNIEVDTFRYFNFQFEKKDNWGIPSIEVRFNNYKSPYSDLKTDLENTFKVQNYLFTEPGYPSSNPYQFSRVTITYVDSLSYIFNSRNSYHDYGNFEIYKIENVTTIEKKNYLKLYIHFECILNSSKTFIELKNAEAVIAFEY